MIIIGLFPSLDSIFEDNNSYSNTELKWKKKTIITEGSK